ncbi:unnamed protein product [Phaedon cochleariae]|uniref:RING-CH-type domain-containing protein n=1 Tax=Phaedon cochleariae TaxID=80249 RepID=A0A9N9SG51_PHACE|nr:unnamed protein product [Phaedon cochleariae]
MQDVGNNNEIFVTLVLTESTTSLLNLSLQHLEHFHPENSRICLITPSEYSYLKEKYSNEDKQYLANPGCSNDREGRQIEEIYLKISSDVALFSTNICSSSSFMYDISDEDLVADEESTLLNVINIFEARKIHTLPLLSARSMAHANKLNVHSHDIYVSLLDSNSSTTSRCHICRICHGGDSMDDLLTTCRCRGSIALVHLKCLERWLRESNHSSCELCQHHYKIVREPKYGIPWSVVMYLKQPGPHLKDILLDLLAFSIYTPSAIASTYMLMVICESLVKNNYIKTGTLASHIVAFSAVFGMAAIDFTYTSWLVVTMQRHIDAWREWYSTTCTLKLNLPQIKLRPQRFKKKRSTK